MKHHHHSWTETFGKFKKAVFQFKGLVSKRNAAHKGEGVWNSKLQKIAMRLSADDPPLDSSTNISTMPDRNTSLDICKIKKRKRKKKAKILSKNVP